MTARHAPAQPASSSSTRERVAEANRQFYALTAERYEQTESHLHDRRAQETLTRDLDHILRLLRSPSRELRCLDACAGTGTVTLKLLRHPNVRVDACDISPEMLELLRAKARAQGVSPTLHRTELAPFLQAHEGAFDLIVFSSALHHLEDYGHVLELCWPCLKPGGMVYTAFDPTPTDRVSPAARVLRFVDYATFKVVHQTADAPLALMRRLRRTLARDDGQTVTADNVGVLAEYHVPHGIDDEALADRMSKLGYRVLWHVRQADARSKIIRALLSAVDDVSSFKLLLERV